MTFFSFQGKRATRAFLLKKEVITTQCIYLDIQILPGWSGHKPRLLHMNTALPKWPVNQYKPVKQKTGPRN